METMIESNQYLTFALGKESFALNIGKVREVLNYTAVTEVPGMPQFIDGVINLRGNVVPVIDLRMKLGMDPSMITGATCIVIVEVDIEDELSQMGVLIDAVNSVIDIPPDEIAPPPKVGLNFKADYLVGMGKLNERFIIILNIDNVLTDEELMTVRGAGTERTKEKTTVSGAGGGTTEDTGVE